MGLAEGLIGLATVLLTYYLERSARARAAVNDANELKDVAQRSWSAVEAIAGALSWKPAQKLAAAMERAEGLYGKKLTAKQRRTLEALWRVASEAAKSPKVAPKKRVKKTASEARIEEMELLRQQR